MAGSSRGYGIDDREAMGRTVFLLCKAWESPVIASVSMERSFEAAIIIIGGDARYVEDGDVEELRGRKMDVGGVMCGGER